MRSGCFLNVGMNASLHYTRLHCKAAGNSIGIYFGPEKATIINTYAVMKSGMKNLDESGNNGAISSQKAQKRLWVNTDSSHVSSEDGPIDHDVDHCNNESGNDEENIGGNNNNCGFNPDGVSREGSH
ncbi:putative uncharacterized protein DDB_G0286901 isoform X3 [Triticum aestivum]|uniref:putative uncharacterized protein DDB_G0286901 isoform X3 n=2 Tax=Triticum aestivum TaxID=4565 RepID=UPI001D007442|nr:putative uncharacterized protein DDB_G0286901 isoform X3 [Triticum aestivum]